MLNQQQIQELADLAAACRPHGAPHWDKPGIVSALRKVEHVSLGEVMRVVIAAAEDRSLVTPAAIGNLEAPVWRAAHTTPAAQHQRANPGRLCSVCSEQEHRCRALWSDDHEYLSNDDLRAEVAAQDPMERAWRTADLRAVLRGGLTP